MSRFLKLLRTLLFIPQPRISSSQALEIARAEADRRGWLPEGFAIDPRPEVVERLRTWCVYLFSGTTACSCIVISQQTGEIVKVVEPFPR
jgi:hypothetical protein